MTAPASYGPLRPIHASSIRPGDGVTFGRHTGWYRVRKVTWYRGRVVVHSWFRRKRIVPPSTWVWVRRGEQW